MEKLSVIPEEFKKVANIYLPQTAIPLDLQESIYRGCKLWIFRRSVKRWRPTPVGLNRYRTTNCDYNSIPENEREYYQQEFWMGISDYFDKYGCEFEYSVEMQIGSSLTAEEAKNRLEYFIDKHYTESMICEDIP